MAKSASPIRLQADLMQAAEITAKRYHRSTAEQIEYWADLGRTVASTLDPDVLLSVAAGLTVI
ncbi:MAG: ParD-like family protein [Methylococcaceae bacterium]|nr:ParD-like family protein [Methylococcaceae bacterium]